MGSQATTTEAKPASAARASPHATAADSCQAFAVIVRRAITCESWSHNAQTCLSAARSKASTADSRVITDRNRVSLSLR